MFRRSSLAALCLLPALVACSGSHSLSHEDLRSEFRASISVASETEAFLSHLDGHTYSAHFIRGHLSSLRQQASEIDDKLNPASAATQDASSLATLRSATNEFTQTLNNLQSQIPNASAQTSAINHLHSIREQLAAKMPQ